MVLKLCKVLYLVMYIPSHTALMPSTELASMYKNAKGIWLLLARVKVSLANVEKVVNPPQNPVISKKRILLDGIRLMNNPMQKQPNMLTAKVAQGKGNDSLLTTNIEVKNRKTLPIAPPAATNNICLIIWLQI